jgi:uncharacterized membrane protein YccC
MVDSLNDLLEKHKIAADHPVSMIVRNLSRSHVALQKVNEDDQRPLAPKLRQDRRTVVQRAKELLNWQNPRLRHALWLGLCFLIGFSISEVFDIAKGE